MYCKDEKEEIEQEIIRQKFKTKILIWRRKGRAITITKLVRLRGKKRKKERIKKRKADV